MSGRLLFFLLVLGLLAVPCPAQAPDSSGPSSAAPPAGSTSPGTSPATPKKVWTNDDLSGTRGGSSAVCNKRNQSPNLTHSQPVDAATVSRIKKSLDKLEAQLDDVNKKLQSFKEFQDGEPVSKGERDLSKGYSRTPIDQQIAQLQDKKKDLEQQIGDLMDEARKTGIDPGQLR